MTLLMRELIHCICYAPSAFISDLACAQMLHIKKPPRYALIMTLLHIVPQLIFASLNNLDSEGLPVLNSVIQISLFFLGPMIASRDSVPRRLFAASLCLGASLLASTAAELIFVSLGGDIQANVGIIESGPAAYIAMFVLSFAILVILLPLLLRVWNRLIRENADTHFWEYLLYPATQAVILAIAIRYTSFDSFIPARHIALAIVTALSVVADFLLLRSIREHASRAVDTARAEWFEQLLEQQQSYYEHILSDQEDAAKIRHDFRNQLQTAYSLVDSGDREAARAARRNPRHRGAERGFLRKPRGERPAAGEGEPLRHGGHPVFLPLPAPGGLPAEVHGAVQPVFQCTRQRLPRRRTSSGSVARGVARLQRAGQRAHAPVRKSLPVRERPQCAGTRAGAGDPARSGAALRRLARNSPRRRDLHHHRPADRAMSAPLYKTAPESNCFRGLCLRCAAASGMRQRTIGHSKNVYKKL